MPWRDYGIRCVGGIGQDVGFLGGLPLFLLGGALSSPSVVSAGAGLGLGGLPLGRLGAGGTADVSGLTFGGRPRGLFFGGSSAPSEDGPALDGPAASAAARVFLFLLPGGRPLFRFSRGGSGDAG